MRKAKFTDKEMDKQLLHGDYQTSLQENKVSTIVFALVMIFVPEFFLVMGRNARGVSIWPAFIPAILASAWVLSIAGYHHATPAEQWRDMTEEQRADWIMYHSKWGFLMVSALLVHASVVIAWATVEISLSRSLRWTAVLFASTYLFWVLFCTLRSRWIVRVVLEGPEEHTVVYRLLYSGLLIIGAIHISGGFLHILIVNVPTLVDLFVVPLLLGFYAVAVIGYPFALTLAWRARVQWKHWAQLEDHLNED